MQENIKITREQVIFLVFMATLGNIVYSHTWIDTDTDRAAWVASFTGVLLVIPFAVWILYLGKNYPGGTIFDILEAGLGKMTCTVVSIIYILINIAVAVAMLNMFVELIKTFFNTYTPVWVIMLFLVLVAVMYISSGIKIFARAVEIVFILGIGNFFVSFIFAFPQYIHVEYVIPIFDTSLLGFIKGVLFITGAASECLLLLMVVVRFIPDSGKHYMWVVKGLVFCAVVLSSAILIIIMMLSPELAKNIAFGGVNAAKIIQVGEFIRGLEVFIFAAYQFIAIGKTACCLYCAWTTAKKMFNNWNPRLLLFLTALVIFVPSVWLTSYTKAYQLAVVLGSYIVLPFSVGILVLTSVSVMIIRKRTGSIPK
jgi:spore germination protein KB